MIGTSGKGPKGEARLGALRYQLIRTFCFNLLNCTHSLSRVHRRCGFHLFGESELRRQHELFHLQPLLATPHLVLRGIL